MAESSSAKQRHGGRKRLVSSGNRFAFFAAGVVCVLMGIRNTRLLDPSVKGRLTASSSLTTDVRKTNDNNATTTVTTTPRDSTTVTSSAMAPKADDDDDGGGCNCSEPTRWTAQAGQDRYVWHRVLRPQRLCCQGVFVEFGARNGVEHSNTYALERFQGWKGLLAEVDEREIPGLQRNRPRASVIHGPLCPRTQENVTIVLSKLGGWTGSANGYGTLTARATTVMHRFKKIGSCILMPVLRTRFLLCLCRTHPTESGGKETDLSLPLPCGRVTKTWMESRRLHDDRHGGFRTGVGTGLPLG